MARRELPRRGFIASTAAAGVLLSASPCRAFSGGQGQGSPAPGACVTWGSREGVPGLCLCHLGHGGARARRWQKDLLQELGLASSGARLLVPKGGGGVGRQVSLLVSDAGVDLLLCTATAVQPGIAGQVEAVARELGQRTSCKVVLLADLALPELSDLQGQGLLSCCDGGVRVPLGGLGGHRARGEDRAALAAAGLLSGIYLHGFVGFAEADLLTLMRGGTFFSLGLGAQASSGEGGARAADSALADLQRQGIRPCRATRVLLGIRAGPAITLSEVSELATRVQESVHPGASIIFYASVEEGLGEGVKVSLLAAGERRTASRG